MYAIQIHSTKTVIPVSLKPGNIAKVTINCIYTDKKFRTPVRYVQITTTNLDQY